MKKIALSALIATSLLATGCATHNVSQPTVPFAGTVDSQLKADMTVGEKISGESSETILFGIIKLGGSNKFADGVTYSGGGSAFGFSGFDPIASVKSAAAYDAVSKSGADVIIAPRYVVDVQDYGVYKAVKVKVDGYKGTIKSIR